MSTPSRRVFISRVSREFGKIAEDLRSTLQAVGESGRTQVSFRQEEDTDTTLSKLSEYIHGSDVVLSLIGEYSGSYPPDSSMGDSIHPAPPARSGAKFWRDLIPPGLTRLSYTQWEVILARFWKNPSSSTSAAATPRISRPPPKTMTSPTSSSSSPG